MKKRLLVIAALFLLFSGFTLTYDAPTKYTDNTAIGPEAGGINYNVEMDGAVASGNFAGTAWVVPSTTLVKGSAHNFRVRAVLGTGEMSAWSPVYSWVVPLAQPLPPANLQVVP